MPRDDASFDAVLCCVGVQYLQHPVAVFAEARRLPNRSVNRGVSA
ncbi:MAG: methyltransferase domain-containing protein [Pseudomonadota bacterium]